MMVVVGEKSRRHRPMVQSSRGWDEAPHSGWGVKPSAPSKGKGAKSLKEPLLVLRSAMAPAPLRPAFPARSLPPATPERLARSAGRAHLSSPARVGWAGTAVGRPARSCGGCWAGARGAAGRVGRRARGRRLGPELGDSGLRGLGALLCFGRPRHRPAIDCWFPVPYAQVGVPGPGEGPLGGRGGGPFGSVVVHGVLRGQGAGRGPLALWVECRGPSPRPLGSGLAVHGCQPRVSFP